MLALALVLAPASSVWVIATLLVVYGLGLASAQLAGTVLGDVPTDVSGQGSATQSTVRQVGSALGTAFSGAALSVALASTLPSALKDGGLTGGAPQTWPASTRDSAGTTIAQLRAQGNGGDVLQALERGFADATRASLPVASVLLLLGLVGAVRLKAASRTSD